MSLWDNWLNHSSLVLLGWWGQVSTPHTLCPLTIIPVDLALASPNSHHESVHARNVTSFSTLVLLRWLQQASLEETVVSPLLGTFYLSLLFTFLFPPKISLWGLLKVLIAQHSARSRDERKTVEFIDPIMAKHTNTSDSGFCNSSAIPPSSGKGSPCWFINLGTKCLSQTWWVNRPASPVALYSYIWQAELHKGFCPHFPSVRLYEDKWLNPNYGQGYLISDPQPLALLQ